MAKRKQTPLAPIAAYERNQAVGEMQSHLAVITPEQRAKGTYDGDGRMIVNRGGTPVMRWHKSGKLSDPQLAAIEWCQRLWHIAGQHQRITAQYGERIYGQASNELLSAKRIAADSDLTRFRSLVSRSAWQVFENVCRFGMASGVAGGELGYGSRSAEVRAHTLVCETADRIVEAEGLIPAQRIRVA